jgi:hypothetical protein
MVTPTSVYYIPDHFHWRVVYFVVQEQLKIEVLQILKTHPCSGRKQRNQDHADTKDALGAGIGKCALFNGALTSTSGFFTTPYSF